MRLSSAVAGIATVVLLGASPAAVAAPEPDFAIIGNNPTFAATVGQPVTISGRLALGDYLSTGGHPTRCQQAQNISISWGDGASSPPTSVTYEPGYTGKGTSIAGRHTFAADGDFTGRIEFSVSCTNLDDGFSAVLRYKTVIDSSCNVSNPCAPAPTFTTHVQPGAPPKQRFTPSEKKRLQAAGVTASGVSATAAVVSWFAAGTSLVPAPTAPAGAAVSRVAGAVSAAAAVLGATTGVLLLVDPPDDHYRSVAPVHPVEVKRIGAAGKLTEARARTVNRYVGGLGLATSLNRALLTAVERAQGATLAQQPKYERLQLLAAARYAAKLAAVLNDLPGLAVNAVEALQRARLTLRVTRSAARRAKKSLGRRGLPRSINKQLAQLGPYASRVRSFLLEGVDDGSAGALAGEFPRVLASPAVLRAYRKEATAWRSFAAHTKANPLAAY